MGVAELIKLLEAARRAHEARRAYEAVARMLGVEAEASKGDPREAEVLAELARVLEEELLDDEKARTVYDRLTSIRPGDAVAAEARERSEAKRARWPELVERYVQEAARTADAAFRSSLLVSAAEVIYRYGRKGGSDSIERIVALLREALERDSRNFGAAIRLERVLCDERH